MSDYRSRSHRFIRLLVALTMLEALFIMPLTGGATASTPQVPAFGPPLDLTVPWWLGGTPKTVRGVIVADVDGDGRDDVASLMDPSSASDTNSYIDFHLQNSDGSLAQRVRNTVEQSAGWRIAAADLIPGGGEELLVRDSTGIKFLSYVGLGFSSVGSLTLAFPQPHGLEVADLTGDSNLDLLMSGSDGVWLIQAPLSPSPTQTQITQSSSATEIATGDLTGDGHPDIAVARPTPGVMAGHGDGTFDSLVPLQPETAGMDVVVGDLDADGDDDLALTSTSGTRVFRQDGGALVGDTEVYLYTSRLWSTNSPTSTMLTDLNGDGRLDIAVGNSAGHAAIHLQDEAGRLETVFIFDMENGVKTGESPMASGDLNSDGRADFVEMATDGALAHLQLPPGSKAPTVSQIGGNGGDSTTPNVIRGQINLPNGGIPPVGTVHLTRINPDGSVTKMDVPLLAGLWSVFDHVPAGGDYTYSTNWDGNDTLTGSTSESVVITARKKATYMHATFSRNNILYGQSVEVSYSLSDAPVGSVAGIWATIVDAGVPVLLGELPAEPGQTMAFTLKPQATGSYGVLYEGTDWYASSSAGINISVRARVIGKMLRGRRVGKYRVYSPGSKVLFVTAVKPPHPGEKVILQFEAKAPRWRKAGEFQLTLNNDGVGGVALDASRLPLGMAFRVRTTFDGDGDHLKNVSKLRYFKVLPLRSPEVTTETVPDIEWERPPLAPWWHTLGSDPVHGKPRRALT